MKGDLAAIRAESVVLRRTEQILKGRDEVMHASVAAPTPRVNGRRIEMWPVRLC